MAWIRFRSCPARALLFAAATAFVAQRAEADSSASGASTTKTSSTSDSANKAEALKAQSLAMAAHAEGRDGDAADLLWRAWELHKDRIYICNRAGILAAAGRNRDAAESYILCQRALLPNDAKTLAPKIERELLNVRKHVGAISISTSIDGADVIVDGRSVGKSPLSVPIFVEPGDRPVLVRAPGYWEDAKMVYSEAGSWIEVYSELERIDPDDAGGHVAKTPTRYVPEVPAPVQKPEPPPAPPAPQAAPSPAASAKTSTDPQASASDGRGSTLAVGVGLAAGGAALGITGLVLGTRSMGVMTSIREDVTADTHDHNGCTAADVGYRCKAVDNAEEAGIAFLTIGAASFIAAGAGAVLIANHLGGSKSSLGKLAPRVMLGATPKAGFASVYCRF